MRWLKLLITAGGLLLVAGLHWSYLATFDIEVTHTEIELPDLPAEFDGYRIVLLSCLHTAGFGPRERSLRGKLQGLEADLLVVAGDFRKLGCRPQDTLAACRRIFEGLHFPDGMLATRGNHDRQSMFGPLSKMGLRILFNDCFTVHRSRSPGRQKPRGQEAGPTERPDGTEPGLAALTFVGVGSGVRRDPDWAAALSRAEAGGLKIGICHSPDGVVSASKHAIPLLLCGHTHGGQVCLPGLGPLLTETRLVGRRFASGLCRHEDTLLYVNRGIGWTALPLRFNCPPEISVLTLRPQR